MKKRRKPYHGMCPNVDCRVKLDDIDLEMAMCGICGQEIEGGIYCLIYGKRFNKNQVCIEPEVVFVTREKKGWRGYSIDVARGLDGWHMGYEHFNGGGPVTSGLNDLRDAVRGVEPGEVFPGHASKQAAINAGIEILREYIEDRNHDGSSGRPHSLSKADWNMCNKAFYEFANNVGQLTLTLK